jgi:antirestriction protein ArdC
VRAGEKSTMVVFWKQYETKDRQTHEPKTVPVLRYFRCSTLNSAKGSRCPMR